MLKLFTFLSCSQLLNRGTHLLVCGIRGVEIHFANSLKSLTLLIHDTSGICTHSFTTDWILGLSFSPSLGCLFLDAPPFAPVEIPYLLSPWTISVNFSPGEIRLSICVWSSNADNDRLALKIARHGMHEISATVASCRSNTHDMLIQGGSWSHRGTFTFGRTNSSPRPLIDIFLAPFTSTYLLEGRYALIPFGDAEYLSGPGPHCGLALHWCACHSSVVTH